MSPKVSVIIPTFNTPEPVLAATINSALAQTLQDLEVIVVDDGSQDPFSGLKEVFSDSRIYWLALEQNGGVSRARNTAVGLAKSPWIAFLDSGDEWRSDKIELQLSQLEQVEGQFIFNDALVRRGDEEFVLQARRANNWIANLLIGQPVTGSCSAVVMAKQVFEQVGGFDEETELPEDRDLWLRVAQLTDFHIINQPLTILNISTSGRSSKVEVKKSSYLNFIEKHRPLYVEHGLLRRGLGYYNLVIGSKELNNDRLLAGFGYVVKSVFLDPRLFPFGAKRIAISMMAKLLGTESLKVKEKVRKLLIR